MAEVFSSFLGTNRFDLDIHGFDPSGAPGNLDAVQHFDMPSELRRQIVDARVWAGLHYRFSGVAGVVLGRDVAKYDLRHAFEPVALRRARTASTLPIDVKFPIKWYGVECAAGSPETMACYTATGQPAVPGLGRTELNLLDVIDRSDPAQRCEHWAVSGSFVAGPRGSIAFTGSSRGCVTWESAIGTNSFSIASGSGNLGGATGSGVLDFVGFSEASFTGRIHLTGTLSAPNYAFDTTPPTLSGIQDLVLRAKTKRGARARFVITATDAVDGSVPVSCKPQSGSWLRTGTTRVTCTATDSSANTAQGSFTVRVRRG
jgi:hypothetical protein